LHACTAPSVLRNCGKDLCRHKRLIKKPACQGRRLC
jgi:hypothetical protein